MAKALPTELQKYFDAVNRIRSGHAEKGDIEFFLSYTPEIDEAKVQKFLEGGHFASYEEAHDAMLEAGRKLQSSPEYKQQILDLAAGKLSDKISNGVNLVLGGTDIAASVNQIKASDKAIRNSRRPSRPAIPQRDQMLQQALRSAQEGQFDAARATAPVQAQIQDQYLSDVQNAKTASTGQAGAYGSYIQAAANRRNRAALDLAPIQDQIRRGQEARYDNLLGQRLDETQQMYRNQAALYPYDLNQYQNEQQAAASLGSVGRSNLRGSLYNAGGNIANLAGDNYMQLLANRLRNQAVASGMSLQDAETYVVGADKTLRKHIENFRPNYNPQHYYEQSFIG